MGKSNKRNKGIKKNFVKILLILIVLLILLITIESALGAECTADVDYQLYKENQAYCNIDLDCSVYGIYHHCITSESRMNDEIKDILEEDTTLNTKLISAWKSGYNGICAKIKSVTTFPDCTTSETWKSDWTGTLVYSNQIPTQYKTTTETKTECPTCPECKPEIKTEYVNTTNTVIEYKTKLILPPIKSVFGYFAGVVGLIIGFLIYARFVGFNDKHYRCKKHGTYSLKKLWFVKKCYYCKTCRAEGCYPFTQPKSAKHEAGKDFINSVMRTNPGLAKEIKDEQK